VGGVGLKAAEVRMVMVMALVKNCPKLFRESLGLNPYKYSLTFTFRVGSVHLK